MEHGIVANLVSCIEEYTR